MLDRALSASGGGNQVMALALTTDRSKPIVGGKLHSALNGNTALGLGAVNPATGATASWNAASTVKNAGLAAAITSLAASNDSDLRNRICV